jgi:long-subunit fatty acid transport protein
MKKLKIALILIFLISNLSYAKSSGEVFADFLKLGIDARAMGMGGAFCSVADDVHAVYWNPAGLRYIKKREMSVSHLMYIENINYDNLQYAQRIKKLKLVLGFDARFLYTKDERRTLAGKVTGEFQNYNSALTIATAFDFSKRFYCGLAVKGIQVQLDDDKSTGYAGDIGFLYKASKLIKIGAVYQNAGDKMEFNGYKEELPTNIKAGASYRTPEKGTIYALDVNIPNYGEKSVSAGVEVAELKYFPIRVGYKYREEGNDLGSLDGLSFGIGFKKSKYSIDYAYVPFGDSDDTHRFTFNIIF